MELHQYVLIKDIKKMMLGMTEHRTESNFLENFVWNIK